MLSSSVIAQIDRDPETNFSQIKFLARLQDERAQPVGRLVGFAVPDDTQDPTNFHQAYLDNLWIDPNPELDARKKGYARFFLKSVLSTLRAPENIGIEVVHAVLEDARCIAAVEAIAPGTTIYSLSPDYMNVISAETATKLITEKTQLQEEADTGKNGVLLSDRFDIGVYGKLALGNIDMNNWPEATFRMRPPELGRE